LHLPGFTNRGGHDSERVAGEIGVGSRKDDPVEHVEHFLAEIEPKIFGKMEALGKAEVLVQNRERSSKAGIQCCQIVVIPTFAGVPRISATETAFGNRRGFCR
jgi:hypothetical protein